MKKFFTGFVALAFLLTACGPSYTNLDPRAFSDLLQEEDGVQLLDVRTAGEFAAAHIPGAVNIDVDGPAFADSALVRLDTARPVAVYCKSGRRSAKAAGKLTGAGFVRVLNLDGGIEAWTGNGGTVADDWDYIVFDGQTAPDFEMELMDDGAEYDPDYAGGAGAKIRLSDLRGKVVLLQFTASWCGVCRKEMPHLESEIWQRYKEDPDFVFIGIDRDEPVSKMVRFKEVTGVTYPFAFDPEGRIFDLFAVHDAGITRNVLIDKEGTIVLRTRLFDEEAFAGLVEKIADLLQ